MHHLCLHRGAAGRAAAEARSCTASHSHLHNLTLVQWLDELLPEDAAERCRGRVRLVVTEVPSLRLRYLEDFESKEDLIDACSEWHAFKGRAAAVPRFFPGEPGKQCRCCGGLGVAPAVVPSADPCWPACLPPTPCPAVTTVHIPFFLDGNASRTYRGQPYIDGRCAPGCCPPAGAACHLRLHPSCLHTLFETMCYPSMPSLIPPARSLWDFLLGDNSALIKCNDEACVVDYVSAPRPACCPADGQGMELALVPSPVRLSPLAVLPSYRPS